MAEGTKRNVTGTVRKTTSGSRFVSKKAANRAAAAKVYVAALEKAGQEAPESVKRLAQQAR
ncbi:hypothetical protein [Sinomonas sp. R1AF57]|jgi:hypothetical protein|uniref:hypothetical protein n=1 Tax=Sinomonas sp. R1AF57 TaxID=2020377 RepID=UPI000B5F5144|nr:hypothetical protein [Sinomonas sp. R1AF57]ASN53349.1 hypothetical protein CGQ25_15630 [Sinomonas sp. R1AF57]